MKKIGFLIFVSFAFLGFFSVQAQEEESPSTPELVWEVQDSKILFSVANVGHGEDGEALFYNWNITAPSGGVYNSIYPDIAIPHQSGTYIINLSIGGVDVLENESFDIE